MWKHRTNKGRVVYDRKPSQFTPRDLERIGLKLAKNLEKPAPGYEKQDFAVLLTKVLQTVTEELLAIMLSSFGAAGLSNELRETLEDLVGSVLSGLESLDISGVTPGGDPGPGRFRW